jgi:aspartyl protease family protein
MGLQDRDYYREKYKEAQQSPKVPIRNSGRNSTGIKYLLYPFITMAALWYGADNLLDKINGITLSPTQIDLVSGGVILKTDRQGHFRGIALINNVPMPFMIDTGATKTSIPAKMAVAAGLPLGSAVQTNTAGGQVVDSLTRINSLKIGNAEIKNLDANINQYLDEVLIGMNTLKYFHITQSGNTLTLVANSSVENNPATDQSNNRMPIDTLTSNKPITLKKTITCDERKVCRILYSNRP